MCAVTARNRRLLCVLKIKGRKTTNGAPVAANTLLYSQKPAKRLYHDKYPKYHLEKARQKKKHGPNLCHAQRIAPMKGLLNISGMY